MEGQSILEQRLHQQHQQQQQQQAWFQEDLLAINGITE